MVVISVILIGFGSDVFHRDSVTFVYAQELIPRKIGSMSGLIVGLAFEMGAIGSPRHL